MSDLAKFTCISLLSQSCAISLVNPIGGIDLSAAIISAILQQTAVSSRFLEHSRRQSIFRQLIPPSHFILFSSTESLLFARLCASSSRQRDSVSISREKERESCGRGGEIKTVKRATRSREDIKLGFTQVKAMRMTASPVLPLQVKMRGFRGFTTLAPRPVSYGGSYPRICKPGAAFALHFIYACTHTEEESLSV